MSHKLRLEDLPAPAESPRSERDPEPGERFEGYIIKQCIGEGGMGSVYEAVEEFSGSVVAIKFLRGCFTGREDFVLRLQQESKFYSKLKHPNIVRMNRAGITQEGRVFIVMERLRAKTLRRILDRARKHQLDFLNALHLLLQIAEALGAAHEAGVWHRDLKPENVMVGTHDEERGHVWVLDFGIATDRGANTDELPRLGTYRYLSPEQVRGQKPDGRADIYAFGIMAYEMLSGHHTFLDDTHEATVEEMASGHLYADLPRPVYELAEDCPELIWPILERCLARAREERYPSFDEVATDLRALIRSSAPPEHILVKRVQKEKLAQVRRSAFDSLHESELSESTPPGGVKIYHPTEPLIGYVAPDSVLPFSSRAPQGARGRGFTEEMPRGPLAAFVPAPTAPLGWSPPPLPAVPVLVAPDVTAAPPVSSVTSVMAAPPRAAQPVIATTSVMPASAPRGVTSTPTPTTFHESAPKRRRASSYVAAPLMGLLLTLAGTVVVLSVRESRQAKTSPGDGATTASTATITAPQPAPLEPDPTAQPTATEQPAASVEPALTAQPVATVVTALPRAASSPRVLASSPAPPPAPQVKPVVKPTPAQAPVPTASEAVHDGPLPLFDFKDPPAPPAKPPAPKGKH